MEKIELFSEKLVEKYPELVIEVLAASSKTGIKLGWHYLLDLVWILNDIDLPKGSVILDAGAGNGLLQFILADRGYKVISADVSNRGIPSFTKGMYNVEIVGATQEIEHVYWTGKQNSNHLFNDDSYSNTINLEEYDNNFMPKIIYYHCDIENMRLLEDKSVDCIVSVSALEHNPPEKLNVILNELSRVLKKDNYMYITVSGIKKEQQYHKSSRSWLLNEEGLKNYYQLSNNIKSNFNEYDDIYESLLNSKYLKKWLASFYYNGGENGMPWGKWDVQYMPVGIKKCNDSQYILKEKKKCINENMSVEDKKITSNIEEVKNFKDKKIVFFGTGNASKMITECFPYEVNYYVDNDENKWGTKFNGKDILRPNSLLKEDKNNLAIIICSQWFNSIGEQLTKLGFFENVNFWNGCEMFKARITSNIQSLELSDINIAYKNQINLLDIGWAKIDNLYDYIEKFKKNIKDENTFGLKSFGNGLVEDKISNLKSDFRLKVLDVGGGYNTLTTELCKKYNCESWLVDDFGLNSDEEFWLRSKEPRIHAENNNLVKYIFERVGDEKKSTLPTEYFDIIYSISVLEHIPIISLAGVFDHMITLLKPGGRMIHAIDLNKHNFPSWKKFLECNFNNNEINTNKIIQLKNIDDADYYEDLLFEPVSIVYKYYFHNENNTDKKYLKVGTLYLEIQKK